MSGRKTEPLELNGVEYKTQQHPPMQAYELLGKLREVIMASLNGDETAATMAVMGLPRPVLLETLQGTTAFLDIDGKKRGLALASESSVNTVFEGRFWDMFKVIDHAIKVNFADFPRGSGPDAATTLPSTT